MTLKKIWQTWQIYVFKSLKPILIDSPRLRLSVTEKNTGISISLSTHHHSPKNWCLLTSFVTFPFWTNQTFPQRWSVRFWHQKAENSRRLSNIWVVFNNQFFRWQQTHKSNWTKPEQNNIHKNATLKMEESYLSSCKKPN